MLQGTYTAALGIGSHQQRIDTIANNLANVSTNGYKAVRTDFKDAIYTTMSRAVQPQDNLNMQKGHGVLVGATTRQFTQGQYQETQSDTDLLIEGDGFFRVQAATGEQYYTRTGNFTRSVEGDGVYLVNQDGLYLLGNDGQRIRVGNSFQVHPDGRITEEGSDVVYGQIGLARFANQEGLLSLSNNLYLPTEASGLPTAVPLGADTEDTVIHQYAIEGSNVDLGQELSTLVRATRSMQVASRALSTADEMDGTANSIRR